MRPKDVVKQFKEAPWRAQEELQAFVDQSVPLAAGDVEKLLSILVDQRMAAQGGPHRNRCAAFEAIAGASLDRALFGPFAKALDKADATARRVLVSLLPRVNDVEAHELLCRQLGADSQELRRDVAELLKQIGGPAALGHLAKLVKHPGFHGRTEAMDIMVPKARHRAIPLLQSVLEAGAAREKIRALRYLQDPSVARDHEAAVATVRAALGDADRRVIGEAFQAFGALVDEGRFFDELEARIYSADVDPALIESLGAFASSRALGVLEQKVRIGPNSLRMAAIAALRQMGTEPCVPMLVEALEVDDMNVRRAATEALGDLAARGTIDLAQITLQLLRSKKTEVRRTAAHLARQAEDTSALTPRLLEFLRDEDWWVRERVMDALVEMGAPNLTEHIVEYLQDESPVIRRFAIGGLLRLKDAGSLGAILRAAGGDDDWWVREQAVQSAAELGDPRAVPYIKKLVLERADLRIAGLEALRHLHANDELLELAELAGDEDPNTRHAVLKMLREHPRGREASFYVQTCVGDPEPRVAKLARELLAHWEIAVQGDTESAALGLIDRLLVASVRNGAEDLVLAAGRSPYVKRLGAMQQLSRGVLGEDELLSMVKPMLGPIQLESFEAGHDVDFSYEVKSHGLRFRVNLFRQMTGVAAVFRSINQEIHDLTDLGLPEIVRTFGDFAHGLVLVGGPTGSGKSTTLAALIDYVNRHTSRHVITIEDPIEVVHPQRECLVNQRELGTHARSFNKALRSTLRQDPDVILVGELRDLDTIEFAVNAAETGHLVFGTVHTVAADHTIDRMVHAFPASQQGLVRSMLAESLRAVLCQQLLRRIDQEDRRALACEVMINNEAISNLIRKDKGFQIGNMMMTHREMGMRRMDDELERLVRGGVVDADEALMKSVDKNAFISMLVQAGYLEADEALGDVSPEVRRSMPPAAQGRPSTPPTSSRPPARPASYSRQQPSPVAPGGQPRVTHPAPAPRSQPPPSSYGSPRGQGGEGEG